MSKKRNEKTVPRRRTKREKRVRLIVYIMIIAMVLSLFTAGLGGLALL